MEDKVEEMLKIIDDDGDSFAKRAEMYYRKRPELINFVEESFRSYRALAERFDVLSKDLQSANRTIATVFPEQVQFAMDAEDEEHRRLQSSASAKWSPKPNARIPKVPTMPKKDLRSPSLAWRKENLRRTTSSAKALMPKSSGLSEAEALELMDKLQKSILTMQTEKEFMKNAYEHAYNKYWEIENQITEVQAKACSLQDEFGMGTVIEDNEARTLMATAALKSCQESLVKLRDKHEECVGDSRVEFQKIMEAHEKFSTLRNEFLFRQGEDEPDSDMLDFDSQIREFVEGTHNAELLQEKIRDLGFGSTKSLTVTQLAEKVDEIVEKVVTLEIAVSSEAALVKRLKSETNDLHGKVKTLEKEKEVLIDNVETMRNKLDALEDELRKLRSLKENVEDENRNVQTQITEANGNINDLCDRLEVAEIVEEEDTAGLFHKTHAHNKEQVQVSSGEEKLKNEKIHMSVRTGGNSELEHDEDGMEEGDEVPKWKQLQNGLEDRDKIILQEYTTVLRNYQDVKKKLGEMEKKNRDGFIDLALQIRELENAVAFRDKEIISLRSMLQSPNTNVGENVDNHATPESHLDGCPDNMTQGTISPLSNFSPDEFHQEGYKETPEVKKSSDTDDKQQLKMKHVMVNSNVVPAIEDKIRADIDELLEENLEFWLRFSTSFHQINKFQNGVHDLRSELTRLRTKNHHHDDKKNAEERAIYRHLREIQTELTLWLENNVVLKDELLDRYASLCGIQDEISRVSSAGVKPEQSELSNYQAAKFQGEVINMKQENRKIAGEIETGLNQVKQLRTDVELTLSKLDEEFGSRRTPKSSSSKVRIPLRSFLFGVKLKRKVHKPSLFSCMNPSLQRQYSILTGRPEEPIEY